MVEIPRLENLLEILSMTVLLPLPSMPLKVTLYAIIPFSSAAEQCLFPGSILTT
jgi:hypothetical protein